MDPLDLPLLCRRARDASRRLATLDGAARNGALRSIAEAPRGQQAGSPAAPQARPHPCCSQGGVRFTGYVPDPLKIARRAGWPFIPQFNTSVVPFSKGGPNR